ncbi:shikimate dehydrogenase [Candidatus Peregrinibacteria bacterium]|nr:shikimate dehydrogenase [Candidatus Peregrinibacteria bacterium]
MRKYCVIGYPIKHSLSPKIFNRAFRQLKIPAQYEAVEVRPEKLAAFMRGFRKKYSGANVTIPHKEKILRFLDKLSPEAKKIGAVNVIVNQRGKLVGYNTDVFGAMVALGKEVRGQRSDVRCHRLAGSNVVILGAGGAARAIVYGLKKAGAKITVLNRTVSHAEKLARDFKCKFGALENFDPANCDILINATSVGMCSKETPLPQLKKILRGSKKKSIVMDIIYRPRMTKFLRDALGAGCRIITGEVMFFSQAAESFKLWAGKKFPLKFCLL